MLLIFCIDIPTAHLSQDYVPETRLTYLDRFLFLPLGQQFARLAFHDLVLGHDLHLETCNLGLDRRVLALDDVTEGPPLPLDIVTVHPVGGELEALTLQDTLALFEKLQAMNQTRSEI